MLRRPLLPTSRYLRPKSLFARSNQPIDVLRFEATRQILLYSPTGDPHANDVSRTMSEVERCELKSELIIFSTTATSPTQAVKSC
jgi:hypothetical protein